MLKKPTKGKYKSKMWAVINRFDFFLPDLYPDKGQARRAMQRQNKDVGGNIFQIVYVEVRELK